MLQTWINYWIYIRLYMPVYNLFKNLQILQSTLWSWNIQPEHSLSNTSYYVAFSLSFYDHERIIKNWKQSIDILSWICYQVSIYSTYSRVYILMYYKTCWDYSILSSNLAISMVWEYNHHHYQNWHKNHHC